MNRIAITALFTLALLSAQAWSAQPPTRAHTYAHQPVPTSHQVGDRQSDRDHERRYYDKRWYYYDPRRDDWYWRDRHDERHYDYRRDRDFDRERRYHNNHWYYYDRGRHQWYWWDREHKRRYDPAFHDGNPPRRHP
jgi:hypothetical protein